jgi:hypothetical protein
MSVDFGSAAVVETLRPRRPRLNSSGFAPAPLATACSRYSTP